MKDWILTVIRIIFRVYPDSVQWSSKTKDRENCRSTCPIIMGPMVKWIHNPKWTLITIGRSYCFLHQTWAMGIMELWIIICCERQRSYSRENKEMGTWFAYSWEHELKGELSPTEYSQSLRKREKERSHVLPESKIYSSSCRKKVGETERAPWCWLSLWVVAYRFNVHPGPEIFSGHIMQVSLP